MKNFNFKSAFVVLATILFSFSSFALDTEFLKKLEPLQNVRFVMTPDEDHQALYDAFDGAKKSIKVGIFGISSKAIADHLSAAQKRGVQVTVICDEYCIDNPKRLAITEQLLADGVSVHIATPGFTISHWKMFVVDDNVAFISTMNFITRMNQMRDMGVFITNKTIIAEILSVFEADIENSKNTTDITPKLTHPNLVWSPINSEDKLTALIGSATKTIEIWIENMGNPAIHKALKEAVERKVKVRVLTSICGLGMPPEAAFVHLNQLSGYGVEVKGAPFPATTEIPYIHAKTITVDHTTTFIGSENFSINSLQKARELGIIFKNTSIEKQMTRLFEKDWKNAINLPEKPPEKCEALTPIVVDVDLKP